MDTISFSSDQVSKQILVVEDDYDIGDIVENYLKKNGFTTEKLTSIFRKKVNRSSLEIIFWW